jgi:hypothetical protein
LFVGFGIGISAYEFRVMAEAWGRQRSRKPDAMMVKIRGITRESFMGLALRRKQKTKQKVKT